MPILQISDTGSWGGGWGKRPLKPQL